MSKHIFALALVLFLAVFASSAQAFFDPPWITPAQPRAGETVYIHIHGGVCDAIAITQGYPLVTLEGNAIRFVVSGVHEDDLDWCIYGVGTATYPIGVYPAGDYVLTTEMRYTDFFGQPAVLTIGTAEFSALGAVPAAVPLPASGAKALGILLALIAVVALHALRDDSHVVYAHSQRIAESAEGRA